MIFVTVGTGEMPFNRLLKTIDRLCEVGSLTEEIFVQTAYTDYVPTNYPYESFLGYQKMADMIKHARIIITHGGPGTIMQALSYNKIPIVVPRQKIYREVVDDHQVIFSKRLAQIGKAVTVLDVNELETVIPNYEKIVENMNPELNNLNNLDRFVEELDKIAKRLLS